MKKIEYDKVYKHSLEGTVKFGSLNEETVYEACRDGRVVSHLLERQIELWFPELIHVAGCESHDFVHKKDGRLFDAKNFTPATGCKFMPSKMIGTGRKFNEQEFVDKTSNMTYIICDIVDFPKVRLIFKEGKELAQRYPKGNISKTRRGELFGGE